jgi:heme-degrading monooxygenase HmoA
MFVVTNRIAVSEGFEQEFEERFSKRRHLVDQAPGFVRNEVHRPRPKTFSHDAGGFVDDPAALGYYEVKTWWRNFEDFEAWTKSPAFAEAHKNRPPREMFRGPNSLEVHEVFLSSETNDRESTGLVGTNGE